MNLFRRGLVRGLLVISLLGAFVPMSAMAQGNPHRVLVMFAQGETAAARGRLVALGAVVSADLPLIRGAAMTLPPGLTLNAARAVPGVAHVEPDAVATATKAPGSVVQPPQATQWGVTRVQAPVAWATTRADAVKVAIVDTGIDTAHPELLDNLKGGYNAINPNRSYADDNGHGTHVAGIVAAADNAIGVVGVAPQADLYGVKVLGRSGIGWLSDIIEGIQWAVDHDVDVINMSLGASGYSAAFDLACQEAIDSGVTIVAAAGNDGTGVDTVNYPAKFSRVIGVSATGRTDTIAAFSSRGPAVDLAAPGVSIYSTYKGKTYATLSGTSMASPHVAGAAALAIATPVGSDDLDDDDAWDPAEVERRLERTAEHLGVSDYYGAGLVRADLAVAAQ